MRQVIEGRQLNTVTLALNDLTKITFGGGGKGRTLNVMNYGPGKVMVSNSGSITPSFTSEDCLLLMPNTGHTAGLISGPVTLLMIADTADTVLAVSLI